MKDEYKELIKPRTIFAFLFYGAFVCLLLAGKELPQELVVIVGTILGFYYGRKGVKNNVEIPPRKAAS